MPIDTFFLMALTRELSDTLTGLRIDKIHQPAEQTVILSLRGVSGAHKLVIHLGSAQPRLHITTVSQENPPTAPMFCMLLRKYLTGARLRALRQVPLERIVELEWDCHDEMGVPSVRKLIVELMGRNSNLALVGEDGRVLDCLRRGGMDSQRPIAAGMFYQPPEPRERISPFDITREAFRRLRGQQPEVSPEEFLQNNLTGFSPLLCRELALGGDAELEERVFTFIEETRRGHVQPTLLITADGEVKDYYHQPLRQYGALYELRTFQGSLSALLDEACTAAELRGRLRQRVSGLRKTAQNACQRLVKKIALQEQTLQDSRDRERLRQLGDLLMSNLHAEQRGAKSLTVEDYYGEPGSTVTIRLDEKKNLQQNAAQYYRQYTKLKNAEQMVTGQLQAAREELSYWESVAEELSRVQSESDIAEIREELAPPQRHARQKQPRLPQPQSYRSSEGIPFRAGRNNRQNDLLTFKLAGRNDLWLHAQKIPGCHVVIDTSGGPPGEQTLLEAATVAAVYCQASASPKVPVDYARVKHVKKPPGAKPGMVIYHEFKTLLVEPDTALEQSLRVK